MTMNRSDLKILIVEDDPVINTDIKSLLKQEGFVIAGIASKGSKALDLLALRKPNFAIVDIHLGGGISGIEVAEVIHEKYQIPFIYLTSFSDEATMTAAQEQGPYGYLVKPFQDRTLISTITTAWHHYQRLMQSKVVDLESQLKPLTPQEQTVCKELIKGGSYKQICAALFVSPNTLKYHVKNIYTKMEVASRSELSGKILR